MVSENSELRKKVWAGWAVLGGVPLRVEDSVWEASEELAVRDFEVERLAGRFEKLRHRVEWDVGCFFCLQNTWASELVSFVSLLMCPFCVLSRRHEVHQLRALLSVEARYECWGVTPRGQNGQWTTHRCSCPIHDFQGEDLPVNRNSWNHWINLRISKSSELFAVFSVSAFFELSFKDV